MKDNDELDSELTYYNSIEKAILNSPLKEEHEELSAPKDLSLIHIYSQDVQEQIQKV